MSGWKEGARRLAAGEPGPWATRLAWLVLPFAAGPALAAALDPRLASVRLVCTVGLWAAWGVALTVSLVPRAATLTVVRLVMPAALPVALWATTAGAPDGAGSLDAALAVGSAMVATILVLSPLTGEAFVDGSSYGPERRFPLRAPATLLLGPVPVAWMVVVAGVVAGPVLLAAERWVAGAVALAVGVPCAVLAARALHGLARRWVIFVPAGLVLHDPLTLTDPVLFPRRLVAGVGPAPAALDEHADATDEVVDLTGGAPGLVVGLDLVEPMSIGRKEHGGRATRDVTTRRVLFTPSRPGALLREAGRRRFVIRPTPAVPRPAGG